MYLYLGPSKSSQIVKKKYKDKERVRVLFYQILGIGTMIIYMKFDPF